MTLLDEFIQNNDGKYVEAGGSANAKNQCIDLANQYFVDVLGLPKILGTNAKDVPSKSPLPFIKNTPDGVPERGDVVIWSTPPYGHIAIFLDGGSTTFRSFDQNYPSGTPCHIQTHNYNNVLGWLKAERKEEVTDEQAADLANKRAKEYIFRAVNGRDALTAEQGFIQGAETPDQLAAEKFREVVSAIYRAVNGANAPKEELDSWAWHFAHNPDDLSVLSDNWHTRFIHPLEKEIADLKNEVIALQATPVVEQVTDEAAADYLAQQASPLLTFLSKVWGKIYKKG